jgi:hypothetical protein
MMYVFPTNQDPMGLSGLLAPLLDLLNRETVYACAVLTQSMI